MTFVFTVTQELYEKSLVRVEDGSLPADLLEIKTFLTVPQVNSVIHAQFFLCCHSQCDALLHFISCLVIDSTVCFQNLVKVMTICPRHDLVSFHINRSFYKM